jgi:hypothetical protein
MCVVEMSKKARTSLTDEEPSGRPSISGRDEKLEESRAMVVEDTGSELFVCRYMHTLQC